MSKARQATALADLDIAEEAKAQTDGLAETLKRVRAPAPKPPADKGRNTWREGKALIQVAVPKDVHKQLRLMALQRDITLTDVVTNALNDWLKAHGSSIMIP